MKKIVVGGLIALAMTTAFTAAQAAIPGDGISSGSPPGLIASSIEKTDLTGTVNFTKATPALAFHSMGTKGDSPHMAGIKTSSPALASIGGGSSNSKVGIAFIGAGSGDSKVGVSCAQAQASPGGGFALMAREDEEIRLGLSGSPPGSRQVAG